MSLEVLDEGEAAATHLTLVRLLLRVGQHVVLHVLRLGRAKLTRGVRAPQGLSRVHYTQYKKTTKQRNKFLKQIGSVAYLGIRLLGSRSHPVVREFLIYSGGGAMRDFDYHRLPWSHSVHNPGYTTRFIILDRLINEFQKTSHARGIFFLEKLK